MSAENQVTVDQVLTAIRGEYLAHSIAVETKLDSLLSVLYLPADAEDVYWTNFRNLILGTRGLSFGSKVDVMLGVFQQRMDTDEIQAAKKLADRIRKLTYFRNAIAHADWTKQSVLMSGPFRLKTGDGLKVVTPKPEDFTIELNVYSMSGLYAPETVSIPVVDERIKDEQSILDELNDLIKKYR